MTTNKLLCPVLQPVSLVHKNPWFTVYNRGGYFTTEPNEPQIAVLPIVDHKAIVLVKAKRPVIADNTWELPAGGAIINEIPEYAAARELTEETGINIPKERFKTLKPLSVCPNRYPTHPHLFQVNISQHEFLQRGPHDDEITEVGSFTFSEVKQMIIDGILYITLPTTIISRFLLELTEKDNDND